MTIAERPPIKEVAISVPDELLKEAVRERLRWVYRFAGEIFGKGGRHLDIATHDGYALPEIAQWAREIFSYDIDSGKIGLAQKNSAVRELIRKGKLHLVQADANKSPFPRNAFNSATVVEVVGNGFRSDRPDLVNEPVLSLIPLFHGIHHALQPGGMLLGTVRGHMPEALTSWLHSLAINQEQLQSQLKDFLGPRISRDDIENVLGMLSFTNVQWYNQIRFNPNSHTISLPNPWQIGRVGKQDLRSYIKQCQLQPAQDGVDALFWTFTAQKP